MTSTTAPAKWTIEQHFAVWLGAFTTVSGAIGMALNPDFAIGQDATAVSFLGIDWNGWHGAAALLVGIPGIAIAWFPNLAIPYLAYRAITDAIAGLWAALDDRPFGVLYLPTVGDAIAHILFAAIALLGIVLATRRSSRTQLPA